MVHHMPNPMTDVLVPGRKREYLNDVHPREERVDCTQVGNLNRLPTCPVKLEYLISRMFVLGGIEI